MNLVIPNKISTEAPNKPEFKQSPQEVKDTTFWAKLLKTREFMAVCKVQVFQDQFGKEYLKIGNINEISYKKKEKQKEEIKETLDSFVDEDERI